jgi:hypothetical protein
MDIAFIFSMDNEITTYPNYGKLVIGGMLDNKEGLDVFVKRELRHALNMYRRRNNMPDVFSLSVGIIGTTENWSTPNEMYMFDMYINLDQVEDERPYFVYHGTKIHFDENTELDDDRIDSEEKSSATDN